MVSPTIRLPRRSSARTARHHPSTLSSQAPISSHGSTTRLPQRATSQDTQRALCVLRLAPGKPVRYRVTATKKLLRVRVLTTRMSRPNGVHPPAEVTLAMQGDARSLDRLGDQTCLHTLKGAFVIGISARRCRQPALTPLPPCQHLQGALARKVCTSVFEIKAIMRQTVSLPELQGCLPLQRLK